MCSAHRSSSSAPRAGASAFASSASTSSPRAARRADSASTLACSSPAGVYGVRNDHHRWLWHVHAYLWRRREGGRAVALYAAGTTHSHLDMQASPPCRRRRRRRRHREHLGHAAVAALDQMRAGDPPAHVRVPPARCRRLTALIDRLQLSQHLRAPLPQPSLHLPPVPPVRQHALAAWQAAACRVW